MIRHVADNLKQPTGQRTGATLTEVLMSLLIIGVGAGSVISLFPISLLSSIRATNLTNARILEDNVIELIRTNPQIVEGFPEWEPLTNYDGVNDQSGTPEPSPTTGSQSRIVPPRKTGQILSSTNLFFQTGDPNVVTSGSWEPRWPNTLPLAATVGSVTDGSITWNWIDPRLLNMVYPPDFKQYPLNAANQLVPTPRTVYIVDPLGYWNSDDTSGNMDMTVQSIRTRFGANAALTGAIPKALLRHHASFSQAQAERLFSLGDTWTTTFEALPIAIDTSSNPVQIQFANTVDLNDLVSNVTTETRRPRITLFSSDGSQIATRNINRSAVNPTNQTVALAAGETLPPLLSNEANVGNARIEQFTTRYTYLLTVIRRPDGHANVTCVVFYNRAFSSEDEQVYGAELSGDTINVQWADPSKPLIREGNYVYDAYNGHWYRMISVSKVFNSNAANIVVDRAVEVNSDTDTTNFDGGVMFLPGIIHVFNIEL